VKKIRTLFQLTVVAAAATVGIRHALGLTRVTVETYCPFGGLEAAYSLLAQRQFTCSTGERNLALFGALLVLTIVARKSFCGWLCPLGAFSEWSGALGRRLFKRRRDAHGRPLHALEPPRSLDRGLRWLRLPVLVVILFFTYRTGELVFRGYDPYYILFSANGHDVRAISYVVLAVVLIGVVLVPMAWCRYLCPLGVVLWPFSRVGRMRLERREDRCTGCGLCDRACPQSLDVSRTSVVRSGECTLCFECSERCPERDALQLVIRGARR
jgi:polyferredoxin